MSLSLWLWKADHTIQCQCGLVHPLFKNVFLWLYKPGTNRDVLSVHFTKNAYKWVQFKDNAYKLKILV